MKPIEIRGKGGGRVIVVTNQCGVISFESLLCGKQLVVASIVFKSKTILLSTTIYW